MSPLRRLAAARPAGALPPALDGAAVRGRAAAVPRTLRRIRPELAALLVLAAILDLWALGRNGWANEYYSAAVRSMSSSWHDFLYAAFDPSGLQTVDKPPLALWVQALSARVFGFHSLSLLVPQALMGVATVGLTYDLTRRVFGRAAGFAAGLVLALTPITVAISRHNNPDALLTLCLVGALWCVVRGLQGRDGRTRWIVLAGVCAGLGFEAKMAAALLVVPALWAAWLWVAPRGLRTTLAQLAAATGAMVAVGGAWPLLVALTPASDRPWISGTSDNNVFSLIFDYNGLGRLDGQAGGPGGTAGGPGGGPGGGGPFGGSAGLTRLLNASLGGQAGWLLGAALVALGGLLVATRGRRRDPRTGWTVAAGGAFLTTALAFSVAKGIFHPYYTAALAPFTAALVGGGVGLSVRPTGAARMVAPLMVAGGVATELAVLRAEGDLRWLVPILVAAGIASAVAHALLPAGRLRTTALGVAAAALLAGPAIWSVQTLGHATSGTFPAGGPATTAFGGPGGGRGPGGRGMMGGTPPATMGGAPPALPGTTAGGAPPVMPGATTGGMPAGGPGGGPFGGGDASSALAYVRTHGGGTLAVSSQSGAAASILTRDADVAGIGGFSGRESVVSVRWLADAVRDGRLRWVLTESANPGMPADGRTGSRTAMSAVTTACRAVSGHSGLYDCAGRASALDRLA